MRLNHQLREALYNNGFKMSPEAKRQEVEEIEQNRTDARHRRASNSLARELKNALKTLQSIKY